MSHWKWIENWMFLVCTQDFFSWKIFTNFQKNGGGGTEKSRSSSLSYHSSILRKGTFTIRSKKTSLHPESLTDFYLATKDLETTSWYPWEVHQSGLPLEVRNWSYKQISENNPFCQPAQAQLQMPITTILDVCSLCKRFLQTQFDETPQTWISNGLTCDRR